jgi:hypothetical protein
MKRVILCILMAGALLLLAGSAAAHSPVPGVGEGSSPETASVVSEPLKSWAFYTELHEGREAHYFRMELTAGDRLVVNLFIPTEEKGRFLPGVVIIGPGVPANDTPPSYVEVEAGMNAMVVNGTLPDKPGYEPFTPAAYYYLVDLDLKVTEKGTYYVAVHEPDNGGRYGIAIGYIETFTASDWILVPFNILEVRAWEGQPVTEALAPMLFTIVLGVGMLAWSRPRVFETASGIVGTSGGLILLGSGIGMLVETMMALSRAPEAGGLVTFLLFTLPIMAMGLAVVRMYTKAPESLNGRKRALLLVAGILGILLWGGYIVGPMMCIIAALMPYGLKGK